MKSTFWMTAQGAEDELKTRQIGLKCQTCRWNIPQDAFTFQSPDGAVFDTADCANAYESKLGANLIADSVNYLLGEYHFAAGKGDNRHAVDLYDAMRILDKSFYLCDYI